jgi:hypothetical protein
MNIPVIKQINDLLWYLHRRDEQCWLRRRVGWWGRMRAKGKRRYVWRCALLWGGSMAALRAGWDYFVDHNFGVAELPFLILLFVAGGYFVGLGGWAENERRYCKALEHNQETSPQ